MPAKTAILHFGKHVLQSKYAKWVICGTIGFLAEHVAGKMYDTYIMEDVDTPES